MPLGPNGDHFSGITIADRQRPLRLAVSKDGYLEADIRSSPSSSSSFSSSSSAPSSSSSWTTVRVFQASCLSLRNGRVVPVGIAEVVERYVDRLSMLAFNLPRTVLGTNA